MFPQTGKYRRIFPYYFTFFSIVNVFPRPAFLEETIKVSGRISTILLVLYSESFIVSYFLITLKSFGLEINA